MDSSNFDLRRKPKAEPAKQVQPQAQGPPQRPHSVIKDEVLPRLGIAAFLIGWTVMSGLNSVIKRDKF